MIEFSEYIGEQHIAASEIKERLEQLKSSSGFILDRDGLEELLQELEEVASE